MLEPPFLEEGLEILVRSTVQTPEGLRAVAFELSSVDAEVVAFASLLEDSVAIIVIYGFPAGWSEAGRELANRSFDTFRVN